MTDSIRLGRLFGIPVGIHWSLGLFAAFVASNLARSFFPDFAPGLPGYSYVLAGLLAAFLLAVSVLAHEFGHALVARRHGVRTTGITLWFLGGVARLADHPRKPRHALEIALAGPLVSLALAAIGAAMALFAHLVELPLLVVALFAYVGAVNAVLAIFNMIPALPLDGGRALQAWKWSRGGDSAVATVEAARIGRLLGVAAIGLGIFEIVSGSATGLWTVLIGVFVISQARRERRAAERLIAARSRQQFDPLMLLRNVLLARRGPSSTTRSTVDAELTVIEPGERAPSETDEARRKQRTGGSDPGA